jgi:hypothetical protein
LEDDADPVLKECLMADLKYSRTPRQVAGRWHLEAANRTVEIMVKFPDEWPDRGPGSLICSAPAMEHGKGTTGT